MLILVYFPGRAAATSNHFIPHIRELIGRINTDIYNDQFAAADSLIDSLPKIQDNRPFYYLYRVILAQSIMMAAESNDREESFFKYLDSLNQKSETLLQSGRDSAVAYYFIGQAAAFESLYEAHFGHTWSAIKRGRAAGKAFTKGYEIDTTFHDIALGLGSYWYWKSAKTSFINWTPLFKNEKDKGIRLLEKVAASSEISSEAARVSLIWVYINEQRYDEAIDFAENLFLRYPHGLTFLWALGEAYYKAENYPKALIYYEGIYNQLKDNPGNYFNIIESACYCIESIRRINPASSIYQRKAFSLAKDIAGMPIPQETRERQKDKLHKILKDYGSAR